MTKEKAIQRYEGFIRFVLRKPSRLTQANLRRADLLRKLICKSGGTIQDAAKAYDRAKKAINLERKNREKTRFKEETRKAQRAGGW